MNTVQQYAYTALEEGKSIFLTGVAGSGKTWLIKQFYEDFKERRRIAITATTGIASLEIGGKTMHSYLSIGLGTGSVDKMASYIMGSYVAKNRWIKLDLLVIDECSMLDPVLFDKLENIARIVRGDERPFGGIQLCLVGDFLQLGVVSNTNNFCFESDCWKSVIQIEIYLSEIIRQTDIEFQSCLNDVRIAKLSDKTKDVLNKLKTQVLNPKNGVIPTVIHTTNIAVDEINTQKLMELNREGVEYNEYKMDVVVHPFPRGLNKEKFIEKCKKNCNGKETLLLCIGAQVMLLYNTDTDGGLVNGSRGIVTNFIDGIPVVRFLNGREEIISFYTWPTYTEDDVPLVELTQIPLTLAWSSTIHKCQGQTLDYAIINFSNVFTYGQVYVALSRVKDMNGLSIKNLRLGDITAHPKALEFYKKFKE